MKTINVQNPKKQKSKRYLLFTALILVVCGLMIFNAFSNNKNLNEESFDSTKGFGCNQSIAKTETNRRTV